MGKARMGLAAWRSAWSDFREKLAVKCGGCGRVQHRGPWRSRQRQLGVRMAGVWYCRPECLERALTEILRPAHPAFRTAAAPSHRIPLGLLLLSRQQLSAEQLRTALAAQRDAGRGKIGEWLQQLGFSTEWQITTALARQWCCPVLRTSSGVLGANRGTAIPLLLLESFQMIPVQSGEASGTLLVAFSEGIDHSALYAIEQMLGYRTEACLVSPSLLQKALEGLRQGRGPGDVVFDRMEDAGECARIIASYSARIGAEDVRLVRCGGHIWIRLEKLRSTAVNLVLRVPADPARTVPMPPAASPASSV